MADLEIPDRARKAELDPAGGNQNDGVDFGCHWCGAGPGEPCRDDCPSRDEDTTDETEWCDAPGCVRPGTFHPGGLHLTLDGREFADTPPASLSHLRLVEAVPDE